MTALYLRRFRSVIGFHGCDRDVATRVICDGQALLPSNNNYDWLGPGVYFWENNEQRAREFAAEQALRRRQDLVPDVIGAVIDLGLCLDLTDQVCIDEMRTGFEKLRDSLRSNGVDLPDNEGLTAAGDKWKRRLDCAVINMVHELRRRSHQYPYESVRSPFIEGQALYAGTTFTAKTHIQIAIRNPNCIKGTFWPRMEEKWPSRARHK